MAYLSSLPFENGMNYDDLALYEEQRRRELLPQFQQRLRAIRSGLGTQYDEALNKYRTTSASRRAALASSLGEGTRKAFEMRNPMILEDLASRGLASSPTTVADAQAKALKELELESMNQLNQYDANAASYEDSLQSQRLKDLNELQKLEETGAYDIEQEALNNALDLRRSQLEQGLADAATSREEALARDLARQQRKQGLTESLLGAGTNLLGIGLMTRRGGGGGPGSLFGGGGQTASSSLVGGGQPFPVKGAGSGGFGSLLGSGALIGGSGLAASALSKAVQNRAIPKLGQTLGNVAGTIANPIGAQLNKAKEIISNPAKSIKKIFCFDGLTPIEMKDGTVKPICEVDLDDEIRGGTVESIRISKVSDGSMFNYKGVNVTGYHAVKEGDRWVRVKDSLFGEAIPGDETVFSIATSEHRVFVNNIEFADELENDNYEELTIDQSLDLLNKDLVGVN